MFQCHIYRDKWERRVLDDSEYPRRCVECALDFPEIADYDWSTCPPTRRSGGQGGQGGQGA